MSDYEHVIRGADAHSPKASEPPESQFLRSSGEMDPYQGDGDEYMTTRFQSFQDPLQQYQHPDSASQPQATALGLRHLGRHQEHAQPGAAHVFELTEVNRNRTRVTGQQSLELRFMGGRRKSVQATGKGVSGRCGHGRGIVGE